MRCGTHAMSYRALDDRANRLAHVLAEAGSDPAITLAWPSATALNISRPCWPRSSCAAVPINADVRYTPDELRYLFADVSGISWSTNATWSIES